jgi:riboflavin kinase
MAETQRALGADGLATLKELALAGAFAGEAKLSCSGLAGQLDVSTQTASRRLQQLDNSGYIDRDIVGDGQWVQITTQGEHRLQAEYADYRRLFERDVTVELAGVVTSGMGEGRHYISLPGYMEQFVEKLGYEPFPGTLNVDLDEESIRARARLGAIEPITIDGWADKKRTYGPAYCYPATLFADERYEPIHVITPERTHHDDSHLELIAPEQLRETLGLSDDNEVSVRVEQR